MPHPKAGSRLTEPVVALAIFGYTLAYYWDFLGLGFNSDSFSLIFPVHSGGLWAGLAWDGSYHYLPVTVFWWWLQHLFFGLNESAYQALGIAQHGLVVVLAYLLARHLAVNRILSVVAAVLFASGASYYEVVCWPVVGSAYHLSTALYLGGLAAFVHCCRTGLVWPRWLLTSCLALALFSHELTFSLVPACTSYFLFVHLAAKGNWRFWRGWWNRKEWLSLSRVLAWPLVVVGVFLAVKVVMSQYAELVSPPQPVARNIYWFVRGLFATLTFRGDDRFVVGHLVNLFGGPERAWIWLFVLVPFFGFLFVFWFNRVERFLWSWLIGQLLMTQIAIGISPRHLYIPTLVAAILVVRVGDRTVSRLAGSLWARGRPRAEYLRFALLVALMAIILIVPAFRDSRQALQLWRDVTSANRSLRETLNSALEGPQEFRWVGIVNATRSVARDGFVAWTFQNGLSESVRLHFPGRFAEVRLLSDILDGNVANGSQRIILEEIDQAELKSGLYLVYQPRQFRFTRLTHESFGEKGSGEAGLHGVLDVYSPETAPDLDWQKGAWPWLNLPPGQVLQLPVRKAGGAWLVVYNLRQKGRELTVELDGRFWGVLKAPPGQEVVWLNEALALPAELAEIAQITLRGSGTIPANFARVALLRPMRSYNARSCAALWWDPQGWLGIPPGTSLTLPLVSCWGEACRVKVSYSNAAGCELGVTVSGESQRHESPPVSLSDGAKETSVSLPITGEQVVTLKATGRLPALVREISVSP